MTIIMRRVFPIGVETLLYDDDTGVWYIRLKNRTYENTVPIPADKVHEWLMLLGA